MPFAAVQNHARLLQLLSALCSRLAWGVSPSTLDQAVTTHHVFSGLRHVHADVKIKQPRSPVNGKCAPAQDADYGYVCQSFDCSDFYEVPGLKKSKAE